VKKLELGGYLVKDADTFVVATFNEEGDARAFVALPALLKDASEIRSSYGFLLMRLAVAENAEDAYNVVRKEFEEHEAAFSRLEHLLPSYGSPEWHALAALAQADGPKEQP
jgi:hypothetical protein